MNPIETRDPRRWWILIVLCLSTLVLVIDNFVLAVAVPVLAEDLHASAQDIQWILDSYILVFAGLLLTSGSLADRFGRRRVMIVGLALFGVASLGATLASSPVELIVARVVMGVGGALVLPSTLSILITVFDAEERRKAMSFWSAASVLGLVGGPVLGGVLIAHFWWGAAFLINVPVAAVAIVAALTLMPESKGPWTKPDVPGAVLSMVGMTALVWTIIEFPKGGFEHTSTVIALVVAAASLVAFLVWERRVAHPMVPLELFRDRDFAGGSLSLTLVQVANGGLLLVLTQYLQFVLGYSPTEAGLAFIPMMVASIAFNGLGAGLGGKVGNRTLAVTGMLVSAVGLGLLAGLGADSGFGVLTVALVVLGAGAGLAQPAAIAALMGAVPQEQAGVGSALNDTIQQAGAALGIAVLGSVLSSAYTGAMPDSAPAAARQSIGDALALASGDTGLVATAREAFSTAMSVSFLAGGAGILAGALVALFVMRGKTTQAEPVEEPALAE
ncbi:EmrB/QacA subfamily drug resistance transporter [Nocardia tenerifensis]|uniref:EmrB/QacA subfamily drug resistance transporter n=1 Tax=Nocardia tenerifensis TaxID=228006 RepID=A0A318K3I1_9NOCA|nr:MFS transporter [Nocardia tenerifensis]PXX65639.1 EmrB/QacA subfamily drug resistance transporter [Nocardia tenerifensis]